MKLERIESANTTVYARVRISSNCHEREPLHTFFFQIANNGSGGRGETGVFRAGHMRAMKRNESQKIPQNADAGHSRSRPKPQYVHPS
jgi:hypothetical protein